MTVLNTNYTSLEDAWGADFDKEVSNTHKKGSKKKKKSVNDPLCELYGRRHQKPKKPFSARKSSKYASHKQNSTPDMNQYYGFSDDETYPEYEAKLPIKDVRFKSSNPCSPSYMNDDDDDDDEYLDNAIIEEETKKFQKIFSNVYDESDDEVQVEGEDAVVPPVPPKHTEEDTIRLISTIIEREFKKYNLDPNVECFVDERQYLDLVMYTLSGIILIFMMEQFIQIGMKLKPL